MSRGKHFVDKKIEGGLDKLQFGHGCEPWKTQISSMWTRTTAGLQFGHGCEPWKTSCARPPTRCDRRLQFGHGCEPWKTINSTVTAADVGKLQFGHGCEPWKTPRCFEHDCRSRTASIRPRL